MIQVYSRLRGLALTLGTFHSRTWLTRANKWTRSIAFVEKIVVFSIDHVFSSDRDETDQNHGTMVVAGGAVAMVIRIMWHCGWDLTFWLTRSKNPEIPRPLYPKFLPRFARDLACGCCFDPLAVCVRTCAPGGPSLDSTDRQAMYERARAANSYILCTVPIYSRG